MTAPVHCGDPAFDIVTKVIAVTRGMFDPAMACPPVGGGTTRVNFVSGEGPAWDPLVGRVGEADDAACQNPFVWVRLVTRYFSTAFPDPETVINCGGIETINLEIGVGRCVDISPVADYDIIAKEAEWGLDDSFRLNRIPCVLRGPDWLGSDVLIGHEPAMPYGPDGGGIIWSIGLFIGINS